MIINLCARPLGLGPVGVCAEKAAKSRSEQPVELIVYAAVSCRTAMTKPRGDSVFAVSPSLEQKEGSDVILNFSKGMYEDMAGDSSKSSEVWILTWTMSHLPG